MPTAALPVAIRSVMPMETGSAVFLSHEEKTIVILIDTYVAHLMLQALHEQASVRPNTHDLMGAVFLATGCKMLRLVINDVNDGQFYARLILSMENEIKARKIMEIDCRPSDGIILALRNQAPVLCAQEVWDKCDDVTALLHKLINQGQHSGGGALPGLEDLEDDDDPCQF
jgi:uncharacterized protein